MPTRISLSLPEPCTEDWQQMTPTGCGRFCAACQKTVIDFTGMSDGEVIRILKKEDNVCGRFAAQQLGRKLVLPSLTKKVSRYSVPGIAASLLVASTFFSEAFAQQGRKTEKVAAVAQDDANMETRHNYIFGNIVHADRTPFPGITVGAYEPVTNVLLGTAISDERGDVKVDIGFYPGDTVLVKGVSTGIATPDMMVAVNRSASRVSFQLSAFSTPVISGVTDMPYPDSLNVLSNDALAALTGWVGGVSVQRHSFFWRIRYSLKHLFK